MPFKLKLGEKGNALVSTDEIIFKNAKGTLVSVSLFPGRVADQWENRLKNKDISYPGSDPFKKTAPPVKNKEFIQGTIDEESLKYDSATNSISGVFNGIRETNINKVKKFVQFNSEFAINLKSGEISEVENLPLRAVTEEKASTKKEGKSLLSRLNLHGKQKEKSSSVELKERSPRSERKR